MEDSQIIELYYSRNEQAIKESDHKYGPLCHRISLNILSVKEDAEECVNDTWFAAWKRMPPDRPNALGAFFGRITRNLSISRWRVPAPENVEQAIDEKELTQLLNIWLDSLNQDDCSLFVRRYWYGDAVNALASEWGLLPNQISQRLLRLRKKLKAFLEKEGVCL